MRNAYYRPNPDVQKISFKVRNVLRAVFPGPNYGRQPSTPFLPFHVIEKCVAAATIMPNLDFLQVFTRLWKVGVSIYVSM